MIVLIIWILFFLLLIGIIFPLSFLLDLAVIVLQAKSARVCVSRVLKKCRSSMPPDLYVQMFDQLLAVFADGIACPRLSVPLLNTYIFLMTSGYLDDGIEEDAAHVKSLLRTTWTLISRCGDPVKKMTAGSLICTALRFKRKRVESEREGCFS